MKLLDKLNSEQKKVVTTTEESVLVLAGAGSGKTRCIIYRTAYLINKKLAKPWEILIVTFTNKAARELRLRLESTFGISTKNLWIGTFHSICSRILRYENSYLKYKSNFSIYDREDQKAVIKAVYKKLDINSKEFNSNKAINGISKQKSLLIKIEKFWDKHEESQYSKILYKIYKEYQQRLLDNNAMDFDDILMNTALLLDENEEVLQKYQKKFKYVMIDEYQDTNFAQFKIINQIAKNHQKICAVGDDDQAIYSWRGASISNILNFEKDYKNVIKIRLEQNYRSTKKILQIANSLIEKNDQRHEKSLWTENPDGKRPQLKIFRNENEEAKFVVNIIDNLQENENIDTNECVVLYRINAQSRVIESALINKGIKYTIVGGLNFYQRKEIKDIIAYLRILINPSDNESLLRIINFPTRKIGKTTIGRIFDFAIDKNISFYDAICRCDENSMLRNGTKKQVLKFVQQVISWREYSENESIVKVINKIVSDLEMIKMYEKSNDPQLITKAENLKEFIASSSEFSENYEKDTGIVPKLQEYLGNIMLQSDLDQIDNSASSVKLMTMHNTKGLEFDNVFIIGLGDGLMPHELSLEDNSKIEEERRLLYVAMTRARKNLFLSYSNYRRVWNNIVNMYPSRFLNELDPDLLDMENSQYYEIRKPAKRSKKKLEVVLESAKFFKIGHKVIHKTFGKGSILNVEGTGKNAKLTISFNSGQLKKILGSYVELC